MWQRTKRRSPPQVMHEIESRIDLLIGIGLEFTQPRAALARFSGM